MINEKPLVSFIIPAYNEEKFIMESIESCLGQSYPNIEVSVTDDGSTDRTWKILKKNYQNNPKIILDRFDTNRGKVVAVNNSYEQCHGEYIALMCADDVCFENRIESSYTYMNLTGCDLVFGRLFYCDEDLNSINYAQRKVFKKQIGLERIIFDNIIGPTLFINRDIAEKCFPIPETLKFEDWWIGFAATLHGRVRFMNKYLIKYRQHANNDNSNVDDSQIINRVKRDFQRQIEYYRCFYKAVEKKAHMENKKRILRLLILNATYRKLFIEEDAFKRLKFFPSLLRNITPHLPFFMAALLMISGNRIYNLKKLGIYKRFFHYKPDDL